MLISAVIGLALATPALAATEFDDEAERLCYEAAAAAVIRGDDVGTCNRALTESMLSEADRVATLINRGILNSRLSRFEAAIADFDAALERDPRNGKPI